MKAAVPLTLAVIMLWVAVARGQRSATANLPDMRSLSYQVEARPEDRTRRGTPAIGETPPAGAEIDGLDEPEESSTDLRSREKLTGNWGGARDRLAENGLTIDLSVTYVFQGVAAGGLSGPFFDLFSTEGDTGSTFSGDLQLELDTAKAGLWHDGLFNIRLEGRAGLSVVQRAGSVSAVNNDALFPNVVDEFDGRATAITELTYQHKLGEQVAIFAGLMNTAEGDENEIAGSALSNSHFLNTALLYSLVEDATVPNVALGGGISYEPNEDISGSFSVFGSAETAGKNPFRRWSGTTFSTEWTFAHKLCDRPGAQTFGLLYGINERRTDIAADPRLVLISVLLGVPIPSTTADSWAFYYNASQYLHGDAKGGWGVFTRLGISDGNPNLVKWNCAGGVGGIGLLPCRAQDGWGLGVFYLDPSDEDLLQGLGVGDEVGGEFYYNIALSPACHVTLDAQVIDSALPRAGTAWVLGLRTHFDF